METIKCPNCGEEYAPSYRRCPFCSEEQAQPTPSGGRRLAVNRKKKRFWRRVFFVLSLALIIAAICIVVSIVQTLFGEKGTDPAAVSPSASVSPVPDGALTGIAIDPETANLENVRDTLQLSIVATPTGAEADVVWSSTNPAVATVSETGLITAMSTGSATIKATSTESGTITATCEITVGAVASPSPSPSGGAQGSAGTGLNKSDFTLFSAGETYQLSVSGVTGDVTWASDNEAAVTVSDTGLVTAVGTGMANVTATVGEESFSCIVRVK